MITPGARSSQRWDFKPYIAIFCVLFTCISLLAALFLLEERHDGHIFMDDTVPWYAWLLFISLILSFSIFLLIYYTYHQLLNQRLAIVGFAFFIAGIFDSLHLMSYLGISSLLAAWNSFGKSLVYWLLAKLTYAYGLFFLVVMPEKKTDRLGRRWKLAISLFIVWAVVLIVNIIPGMADLVYGPEGIEPAGKAVIALIAAVYAYSAFRSAMTFRRKGDTTYRTLACAFIIMFFCQLISMGIVDMNDMRSLLACILKFLAFMLFFNIFYIRGIRQPYILLSKAKQELNEYAYELDRLVDKRTHELKQVNERLMADLEIARGIQQAMLPSVLPQNEYVTFVSGYLPAENLSGDFYNVIRIDDSNFGIYIGDVSGHGVSAAMLTVFTFQKIMSLMDEIGKEGMTLPSLVLEHLYSSFNSANFSEELYIVLIYGVYNVDTGIFSYASGGLNTSPLRMRPDGSIQELDSRGFAICKLGDLITPRFSNRQVMLFPGDKLILYTDGLVEAKNREKQPYSKERLKNVIYQYRHWDAGIMTEKIIEDVKSYSDRINDDVTILTLEVLRPFFNE